MMRTNIRIGKNFLALAHDESTKRPFTFADKKPPGSRIREIVKMTNEPFGPVVTPVFTHASPTGLRLTIIARIIAGMPMPDA